MSTDETTKPPEIRHVTEGWHRLHPYPGAVHIGRVCEHWVSFDAPTQVAVQLKDGTQAAAGPGPVRSYIGLVLEVGDAQLQVRGRLRLGGERLLIEVDD